MHAHVYPHIYIYPYIYIYDDLKCKHGEATPHGFYGSKRKPACGGKSVHNREVALYTTADHLWAAKASLSTTSRAWLSTTSGHAYPVASSLVKTMYSFEVAATMHHRSVLDYIALLQPRLPSAAWPSSCQRLEFWQTDGRNAISGRGRNLHTFSSPVKIMSLRYNGNHLGLLSNRISLRNAAVATSLLRFTRFATKCHPDGPLH